MSQPTAGKAEKHHRTGYQPAQKRTDAKAQAFENAPRGTASGGSRRTCSGTASTERALCAVTCHYNADWLCTCMSDTLQTPRSTLAASYVRVLVWCKACRHWADADLPALVAAGRGDTPLRAAVPLHRVPLAAHRLRGDREGPAEAVAIVRPRDGGPGTMTSGWQPAVGCITGHRKRSACARRPASLRRRRPVARARCAKFACQLAPAPATAARAARRAMMACPGDACCAPAAYPGGRPRRLCQGEADRLLAGKLER
jgi:hypothetical protein